MIAWVFHVDVEAVREQGGSPFSGEGRWPDEYRLVAYVTLDDIDSYMMAEVAFSLTQHHNKAWWENPGVERVGPETRSTSTGDVVVVGKEGFLCDRVGWKRFSLVTRGVADVGVRR